MVVDDSLTVRKITGRLLEREGYRCSPPRTAWTRSSSCIDREALT
jgi:CheY-like chemotaxis protein